MKNLTGPGCCPRDPGLLLKAPASLPSRLLGGWGCRLLRGQWGSHLHCLTGKWASSRCSSSGQAMARSTSPPARHLEAHPASTGRALTSWCLAASRIQRMLSTYWSFTAGFTAGREGEGVPGRPCPVGGADPPAGCSAQAPGPHSHWSRDVVSGSPHAHTTPGQPTPEPAVPMVMWSSARTQYSHHLHKCLLSAYCIPGTVPGTGNRQFEAMEEIRVW